MIAYMGFALMFAAASLITIADALLKKISNAPLLEALLNPWMIVICLLYYIQIVIALQVFVNKGELALFGNIFVVFYSVLMCLFGVIFFHEHISVSQIIGIIIALFGVLLINNG